jgi:ATP-dependent DNA helicase RecQ
LIAASGLPQRKVKAIISQLEGAGILERRAGRIKRRRDFATPQELDEVLSSYERRHTGDRERLEQVMRYGETTFCRTRFLREYFLEDSGDDCGHCNNCQKRSEAI